MTSEKDVLHNVGLPFILLTLFIFALHI